MITRDNVKVKITCNDMVTPKLQELANQIEELSNKPEWKQFINTKQLPSDEEIDDMCNNETYD